MSIHASIVRLAEREGLAIQSVDPLAGDVSTRRYFRLHAGTRTLIACHYPESTWDVAERFLLSEGLLTSAGLRVPAVLAVDRHAGLMLLEDLGATCYQPGATYSESLEPVFACGAALVPRILSIEMDGVAGLLPPLDRAALEAEMEFAVEALRVGHAGFPPEIEVELSGLRQELGFSIGSMPLAAAHRDFMVRNLVPLADGELGVLDHQDLRLAPLGYDFVSLMNDSLFPPPDLVECLRGRYLPALPEVDYHVLATQRTLKAAGTFARAASSGNRARLDLLAPTLRRCSEHLLELGGSRGLAEWMQQN